MKETDANTYPLLESFKQSLNHPIYRGVYDNIIYLHNKFGDAYLRFCEEMLKIADDLGYHGSKAYLQSTLLYMKDKARFDRDGEYGNGSFEEIREKVYNDKKKMEDVYLPGMLLSYPFAAILYVKYHFYLTEFVPLLSSHSKGIDIGFGPGFYIWQTIKNGCADHISGFDISQHSIDFASRLLDSARVDNSKYELLFGNLCNGIDVPDESFDWCIMTEVLEHVPDPNQALNELNRLLKKGGVLFMTTVIDSNHYDHLTNFSDIGEIENKFIEAKFDLVHKNVYVVKDEMSQVDDATQSLSFICRK